MENVIREIKLARGVLIHGNRVLLAQDIRPGQGHFFLPGGNVERGESIGSALLREWEEELGWKIEAKSFLGCLEHTWSYKRKPDAALIEVFEVNFLFSVSASTDLLCGTVESKEPHLNFSWIPMNELSSINLLPAPLREVIPTIAVKNFEGIWESTLKEGT